MIARIIPIALLVVVAASLLINYMMYQETLSLRGILSDYENKNFELLEKISLLSSKINSEEKADISSSDSKSTIDSSSSISPSSLFSSQEDVDYSSQSITAVGVRPIFLRDGFFEQVRYEGSVMNIVVSVRDGEGLVLVNTEIPTGVDFQTSAKTAVKVAQEHTGIDLSKKDIIFSITADNNEELQAVDGPSAGAAMTILLISDLQGTSIRDDVLITGTIKADDTIGKVGGISEKANVAGKYGAKIFLVPERQAITHIQSCDESRTGAFTYRSCTIEEKSLSLITEKRYEMKVFEVSDIRDALQYFII